MKWPFSLRPLRIGCRRMPGLSHALGCAIAVLLIVVGGCTSSTNPTAIGSNANSARTNVDPAQVTLAVDENGDEFEVVQWLRAAGVRVEKNPGGDERVFDSPACRITLAKYRRMLRTRLTLIAENLANVNSTRDAQGMKNPYRRKFVVADASGTTEIRTDPSPFITRYEPANPDADAKGYVQYPNVEPNVEYVNAEVTSRLYRMVTQILMRFDPTYLDDDGGEMVGIPMRVGSPATSGPK